MVEFRQYDPRDSDAVWELHEWALREAGTDPADIPEVDDLQTIEQSYLDAGGDFLVGITDEESDDEPVEADDTMETFDGTVVAMGGFLPSERGYEDERRVSAAAELHRMRVAPPAQGNGYGQELLTALETRIEALQFDTVLATTALRQRRAVSFYRTAGYHEAERSTLGEYELVHFEKSLTDRV